MYNGGNPDIEHFTFGDHFLAPPGLEDWLINWKIPCVNLTRRFLDGNIVGPPVVQSLCLAMGAAGAGKLADDIGLPFAPLRDVDDWDDPVNRDYSGGLAVYIGRELFALGIRATIQELLAEAVRRGLPRKVSDKMKSCFDLEIEKSERRGVIKGKVEGVFNAIGQMLSSRYGSESDAVLRKIKRVTNLDVLNTILLLVYRSEILEQIERGVDQILAENPNATRAPRSR